MHSLDIPHCYGAYVSDAAASKCMLFEQFEKIDENVDISFKLSDNAEDQPSKPSSLGDSSLNVTKFKNLIEFNGESSQRETIELPLNLFIDLYYTVESNKFQFEDDITRSHDRGGSSQSNQCGPNKCMIEALSQKHGLIYTDIISKIINQDIVCYLSQVPIYNRKVSDVGGDGGHKNSHSGGIYSSLVALAGEESVPHNDRQLPTAGYYLKDMESLIDMLFPPAANTSGGSDQESFPDSNSHSVGIKSKGFRKTTECCGDVNSSLQQVNMWLNLEECSSSLHYDAMHNLMVVLSGQKEIYLFPPSEINFNSYPAYSQSTNHSRMCREDIARHISLLERQEASKTVSGMHTRYHQSTQYHRFLLEAGDVLFIPEGWWHYVTSSKCTFALNYWFDSPVQKSLEKRSVREVAFTSNISKKIPSNAYPEAVAPAPVTIDMSNYIFKSSFNALVSSMYEESLLVCVGMHMPQGTTKSVSTGNGCVHSTRNSNVLGTTIKSKPYPKKTIDYDADCVWCDEVYHQWECELENMWSLWLQYTDLIKNINSFPLARSRCSDGRFLEPMGYIDPYLVCSYDFERDSDMDSLGGISGRGRSCNCKGSTANCVDDTIIAGVVGCKRKWRNAGVSHADCLDAFPHSKRLEELYLKYRDMFYLLNHSQNMCFVVNPSFMKQYWTTYAKKHSLKWRRALEVLLPEIVKDIVYIWEQDELAGQKLNNVFFNGIYDMAPRMDITEGNEAPELFIPIYKQFLFKIDSLRKRIGAHIVRRDLL